MDWKYLVILDLIGGALLLLLGRHFDGFVAAEWEEEGMGTARAGDNDDGEHEAEIGVTGNEVSRRTSCAERHVTPNSEFNSHWPPRTTASVNTT